MTRSNLHWISLYSITTESVRTKDIIANQKSTLYLIHEQILLVNTEQNVQRYSMENRDTVWRIWIPMLGYKGSTTFAPPPPTLSSLISNAPAPLYPSTHQTVNFFLRYQISSTFLDQTTATGTVFPYLKTLLSFCNKCCIHVAKYLFRGHWKINT